MGRGNPFKGLFSKNNFLSKQEIEEIKSSRLWQEHKEEFPHAELIPIGAFNSNEERAIRQFLNQDINQEAKETNENKRILIAGSTEGILIKKEGQEQPKQIQSVNNKKMNSTYEDQIEIEHDRYLDRDYKIFLADY